MSKLIVQVTHTPIKKDSESSVLYLSENGLVADVSEAKQFDLRDFGKSVQAAARSKFPCKTGDLFTSSVIEYHPTYGEIFAKPALAWEAPAEIKDFEYKEAA